MNKKIIAAAACGALLSGIVCADDMKFYVGGDLGYNKNGYSSEFKNALSNTWAPAHVGKAKSKVPTFGLLVGGKFHENFGAEVGYTFYKKAKVNWTGGSSTDYLKANNMYVDLLGYMPVDSSFDLIGAVGVGRMKVKYTINNPAIPAQGYQNFSSSKTGLRVGLGGQYNFCDNFAARAMVRYQKVGNNANSMKIIKNATSLNLGLTYTI